MDLCFIGAGRLATQLARALHKEGGHRIVAVTSRTTATAQRLAHEVGAEAVSDISAIATRTADAFIVAVSDDALPAVAACLHTKAPVFHTAGSVPMSVFDGLTHHGVIYPMQTFSKERTVDFRCVPFFIEASDAATLAVAQKIAASVSGNVTILDSERRRRLHLAAVFACNFANHCYTLAADIVESCGLDFSVMQPLIEETAAKAGVMHPRRAQTGPAVRYDTSVLKRQQELLADDKLTLEIYRLMSESIHSHI